MCTLCIVVLILSLFTLGKGGFTEFSPVSMKRRDCNTYTLFFGQLQVYKSSWRYSHSKLLHFLHQKGYATEATTAEYWIQTNHWNVHWNDGHNGWHKYLFWYESEIHNFSISHPEFSDFIWPKFVSLAQHKSYGLHCAYRLLESIYEESRRENYEENYKLELKSFQDFYDDAISYIKAYPANK